MRTIVSTLLLFTALLVTSCSSVRVVHDYDKEVDFSKYSSFAFYKPAIDEVKISDLDKRRILRAIENELTQKGMTKSSSPGVIVSIYTKEQERVDIYQHYNYGWWGPYYDPFGPRSHISRTTEGTLFIDILDAKSKVLIWQGIGYADISAKDSERKEKKIQEIVAKILNSYPPTP